MAAQQRGPTVWNMCRLLSGNSIKQQNERRRYAWMPRRSKQIPAAGRKWAHLDTITGTPDLSGGNTRRLHTCRMNPAFHADAASCIGGTVRVRPAQPGTCIGVVAAAILAAVEGAILPPGIIARSFPKSVKSRVPWAFVPGSAGPDARLSGRRDARHYGV